MSKIAKVLPILLAAVMLFFAARYLYKSASEDGDGNIITRLGDVIDYAQNSPTPEVTDAPRQMPTNVPTEQATPDITQATATEPPTETPTQEPTQKPTQKPTAAPTKEPTKEPTPTPTEAPTPEPTDVPSATMSPEYDGLSQKERLRRFSDYMMDIDNRCYVTNEEGTSITFVLLTEDVNEDILFASPSSDEWDAACRIYDKLRSTAEGYAKTIHEAKGQYGFADVDSALIVKYSGSHSDVTILMYSNGALILDKYPDL